MLLLAFNLIVNRPSQESGCVVCVCVKVGEKVRKEGRMKVEEKAKKRSKTNSREKKKKRNGRSMAAESNFSPFSSRPPPPYSHPHKNKKASGGGVQKSVRHSTRNRRRNVGAIQPMFLSSVEIQLKNSN
jgi:hypothetical protein